ncbi:MAG: gamma-glutamyl-gamma-aminobutyrate hydrolase family protein [Phycisphaeraceae bacterium]|nr:gamma-glutamyl-gamma-aminobutyrate hydrolase family protein [Phycisphaeraceae bacterium]
MSEQGGRVRLDVALQYCHAVERAGGVPVILAPMISMLDEYAARCDGFLLTGGGDPRTEPFGVATHSRVTPQHQIRQEFETMLLARLDGEKTTPVLGVCLGMQMMCLVAGGTLNQRMEDSVPTHAEHWNSEHRVAPIGSPRRFELSGLVHSRHRQAVTGAGTLVPIASSPDGILEAVVDESKEFYLGVQWHPERTPDAAVGQRLFDQFIAAATGSSSGRRVPRGS